MASGQIALASLILAWAIKLLWWQRADKTGRDADGWTHWDLIQKIPPNNLREQEVLFKQAIIRYFKEWEQENAQLSDDKKEN